jgi:hypothetical protein
MQEKWPKDGFKFLVLFYPNNCVKYTSTTHHRSSQLILGSKQIKKSILDNDDNDDSLKIHIDFLTSLMRMTC